MGVNVNFLDHSIAQGRAARDSTTRPDSATHESKKSPRCPGLTEQRGAIVLERFLEPTYS